jgi:hypothetical protein
MRDAAGEQQWTNYEDGELFHQNAKTPPPNAFWLPTASEKFYPTSWPN